VFSCLDFPSFFKKFRGAIAIGFLLASCALERPGLPQGVVRGEIASAYPGGFEQSQEEESSDIFGNWQFEKWQCAAIMRY